MQAGYEPLLVAHTTLLEISCCGSIIISEIIICDPSMHAMDYPDFIECNFMKNSIYLKRVNFPIQKNIIEISSLENKNIRLDISCESSMHGSKRFFVRGGPTQV